MDTIYLKNKESIEERDIDPETQCEIILKTQKGRGSSSRFMSTIMMFTAMVEPAFSSLYGDLLSPNLHIKRSSFKNKGGEYYINLSRKDQKLPYDTKQDLKRLKLHLKQMDNLSVYESIIRYQLR